MSCPLLLAISRVLVLDGGLTVFVWLATMLLLAMKSEKRMIFQCAALAPLRQQLADLFNNLH